MLSNMLEYIDPSEWLSFVNMATDDDLYDAIYTETPGEYEMALLLSPMASNYLEAMAQRAKFLTRLHFGHSISLYMPLYLSNFCHSGCIYCGYASDRRIERKKLNNDEVLNELQAIKKQGMEEVLLLTGDRCHEADFDYLLRAVKIATTMFHSVYVETFPMSLDEYEELVRVGCMGVTVYQETYDITRYEALHRWGSKRDYEKRLNIPDIVLQSGMRSVGLGVLFGLSDPIFDALALFRHVRYLMKKCWKCSITISCPRVRPQQGGFIPPFPITERFLAQIIFAFRICLPTVHLVLSTRETSQFRDGIAGIGISKMSVGSKTTVGGYARRLYDEYCQFDIADDRDVETFCNSLRSKGLEPVFKNWDAVYR